MRPRTLLRPRMLVLVALAALMGTAVAVLPALAAAPSEAKLEVNENCVQPNWPCWTTEGSASSPQPTKSVTIASGGTVTFIDHGEKANIAWTGTAPKCEPAVPVAPESPKTGWEGKCTFQTAGTYKFESSTLFVGDGLNYTMYEIVVEGGATGTTPTTPTTTTPTRPQRRPPPRRQASPATASARLWWEAIKGAEARQQPARLLGAWLRRDLPGRRRRAAGSRPVRRRRLAGQDGALAAGTGRATGALVAEGGQCVLLRAPEREGQGRVAPSPAPGVNGEDHAHTTTRRGGDGHARRRRTRLN